jgi:hypothetical protein
MGRVLETIVSRVGPICIIKETEILLAHLFPNNI